MFLDARIVFQDVATARIRQGKPCRASKHIGDGSTTPVGGRNAFIARRGPGLLARSKKRQSTTACPVAALFCAASPMRTAAIPSASVTSGLPSPRTTALNRSCW
ncbi:hypothetical protein SAMN04488078_101670 [Antarctobacter heliothermus]|uniref:Uncharacterized protein n=1 Tax=Antarctobacter heliothermus TaxID=74033 RepID=A0A239ESQ5_9RHOB|nr:hypothetical protein SAMN04488078_101670 [Antarctobacter heliothermus]